MVKKVMYKITNKEAIFYIKKLQKTYASMDKKVAEAVDMAIEKLSEQYMGCHGCRHYDSLQTSVICYDCSRLYKDRYEE